MKKIALSLMLSIFMINGQAQTFHYPVGTKWTEIRLDTLKYDSWYSRVGDEWVPNFETVEYYVKGYYRSDPLQDEPFMSVFTDGPEWTDSLTLLLDEHGNGVLASVLNNHPMAFTLAYEFDWQVGDEPYYQELLGANLTAFPPVGLHKFGTIEEIKEGNFGGEKPLKYVDLDGVRIIQGIGVTTWNDGECLFGPVKPYEALSFFKQNTGLESQSATRHYRSMLVHFERNGEVLYDVWPEKKGSETPQTDISINEENFPDEYFRQYLLSKDYGQDGILTAEELKGIKTLILNFDKAEKAAADMVPKIPLRSLKGLEFFTELEVLNCNDCLLTELNLTCNNKLKELECAGNKLTELDLSQNRELRSINCSLNNLEDLDITNNEALTSFVGMHNPFHSALDFSHQHNLKTLYVAICNLNSLDLSQNPELTTLSCIGNDLTYLDLSHNPKLIELYCGDNHGLTEINLKNCPKLQLVLCDECQLKALDLSQCLDLKRVSCINNQLESLILNPDAEVQNSLYILGNRLSEQAMLDFINSLHPNTTSDPSRYRLYAMGPADKEKNECTEKVIKAAYERGWTIFDSTGKIYTATEVKDYAYRPFVEEGKTWTLCCLKDGADPTEKIPGRIEYQYLQGDTLIGGLRYKRWWIDEGENVPPLYAGAAREENLVVYFCPPGKTESQVIYDFSSPAGTIGWYNNFYSILTVIYDVTLGENRIINTETYKGWCRDVSFNGTTVTWLQGVGYMGLVNLPFGGYILLSCTVGNEVLYYDASLMEKSGAEAKKKKLDFTHVIKAQPRAPRHRIQQQDGDMLQGEYSATELFVRLNPLAGYYTATLTDASGQVVYRKTLLTDNVLALNTELTAYGPGDYVLTLENDKEAYTATLSIEPNGIEKVQGSEGSSTSEAAKPSAKGSKVQGLFDLQGRRLQKAPEKGMYIQDGQILVK